MGLPSRLDPAPIPMCDASPPTTKNFWKSDRARSGVSVAAALKKF